MSNAACNQPGQLPRALAPKTGARRTSRACLRVTGILLAVLVAISHVSTGAAAEVNLGITFSPEAARMVRDWRRANGLPQAAEDPPCTAVVAAFVRPRSQQTGLE
jgi:hypothetical protein